MQRFGPRGIERSGGVCRPVPGALAFLLLLVLGASGCASWRELSRQQFTRRLADGTTHTVRLESADTTLTIRDARMEGDSLEGKIAGAGRATSVRLAVPESGRLEEFGPGRGRTWMFAAGVLIPVSLFLVAALSSDVSIP